VLTFDRFHVVQLMNMRLDDLRRELVRAAGAEAKQAIKGCAGSCRTCQRPPRFDPLSPV
jgi:transposase